MIIIFFTYPKSCYAVWVLNEQKGDWATVVQRGKWFGLSYPEPQTRDTPRNQLHMQCSKS